MSSTQAEFTKHIVIVNSCIMLEKVIANGEINVKVDIQLRFILVCMCMLCLILCSPNGL